VEQGGYLFVGRSTTVLNLPILVTHYDAWILKLGAAGDVISSATYGGLDYDALSFAARNQAGGIVAVGNTNSGSSSDAWLVKFDDNGRATWQKRFGVKNAGDTANSVQQTEDGG
jgi:hypothetical protein